MNTNFYPLSITSVEPLTRDSVAVKFTVPEQYQEEFKFRAGQYLTFRTGITGEELRRSYSICRSQNEQVLEVGIKRVEQGIFSNYANDNFSAGMTVDVMPPQGSFTLDINANNEKHYLFVAAGSGITPILAHMSTILESEPKSAVTLVYANKTVNRMMFRERISFLKNKYLDRLNWVKIFSKETSDAEILNGRVDAKKILNLHRSQIINLNLVDEVMLCGPEAMIYNVKDFFVANKFDSSKIHFELFHSDSAAEASAQRQEQLEQRFGHQESSVTIRSSGRTMTYALEKSGDTILDSALDQGADVPYACKGGVCATCKAQLIKGQVEMENNHCLSDDEVAEGMILTCQAHPITDEVEVDYDVI